MYNCCEPFSARAPGRLPGHARCPSTEKFTAIVHFLHISLMNTGAYNVWISELFKHVKLLFPRRGGTIFSKKSSCHLCRRLCRRHRPPIYADGLAVGIEPPYPLDGPLAAMWDHSYADGLAVGIGPPLSTRPGHAPPLHSFLSLSPHPTPTPTAAAHVLRRPP